MAERGDRVRHNLTGATGTVVAKYPKPRSMMLVVAYDNPMGNDPFTSESAVTIIDDDVVYQYENMIENLDTTEGEGE